VPNLSGRGRLFVVSGPSGAGKGTVVRAVLKLKPEVVLSVSVTTRPMRRGELNGVDYQFITRSEFLRMRDAGELLEWAEVYGNFYGSPRPPVEAALSAGQDVLCELDIQGAMSVKRAKPNAVLIFIEPPSMEELMIRLRGRGTEEHDDMAVRIDAAYEEIRNKEIYDHIVVNDDVGKAASEVVRIIEGSG
jgi:guanylate kinase